MTASAARPPSRRFLRRLASHAGLPFVTLDPAHADAPDFQPVNPLAALMLPEAVCRRHRVLPVAYERGIVTLAAPDPFDEVAVDVAIALLGRRVQVVVTSDADLDRALDDAFGAGEPAPGATPRLGELLVARGLVSREAVAEALAEQERTGARIGEALVLGGALGHDDLVPALAERLRMPGIDLSTVEPDPAALALVPDGLVRRRRLLPLGLDATTLYLAAADALDDEDVAALREHTPLELRTFLASPPAIEELHRRVHRDRHLAAARDELRRRLPDESACRVLSGAQQRFAAGLGVALAVGLAIDAASTAAALVALATLAYLSILLYRVGAAWRTLGRRREIVVDRAEVDALDERELPVYTVLVPLHREAAVVPRLVAGLEALDYPRSKLDVRLLCEEGDRETLSAVRAIGLPAHFTVVVVPHGDPQTKPKACDYGLLHARGDYVAVYDAEDRPDPAQLKRALVAFRRSGPRTMCVQARLACFNAGQNLLTRWFAAEQAAWFDLLLPGLAARGGPVPLGGSSNHFVAERLVELGAWDPFNVTEDADLGVRLHKAGYRTVAVDSTTDEEAAAAVGNWCRQRSRWVKGHLQTWLVHMRHPLRLARRLGPRGFLSFHLTVGSAVVLLLNPVFWALTTGWFLAAAAGAPAVFPDPVFHLAALSLLVGNGCFVLLHVAAALHRRAFALVKPALLAPLYWGLISLAAWRGALQLLTRPSYWEKTDHGNDAESWNG